MIRPLIITLLFFLISCDSYVETRYELSDLQTMTLDELRIKRNEIFARHGYIFKSQDLNEYFSKQKWYEPFSDNVDSLLTDIDRENIELILQVENELKKYIIPDNDISKQRYSEFKDSVRAGFIDHLLKAISDFQGKRADTTVIHICNIDDSGDLDTLKSRVYYYGGNIYLSTTWTRDGVKMWEDRIENPYLWISDEEEFQYDTRSPWVSFTVGIYHAIPETNNISSYSHISRKMVVEIGMSWCQRKNIQIVESEYAAYLDTFKGDIIGHGDPEVRHEYLVWYEPVKDFVLFYAP